MPLELGSWVVILFYLACLAVILVLSPRLTAPSSTGAPVPFWRNVRFWASLAAIVQIAVYALLG